MLSLSIPKLCTHSQSSYGVYTLQAHVWFQNFKFSREINFFMLTLSTHVSGFTLHTVIWFTLSKHMLGLKLSNIHGRSFFHAYTLHTCFRVYSPYSYLVYTLQTQVTFKSFEFSQKFIFFILTLSTHVSGFTLHTVIWFTLSKHMLGSKHQIFTGDHFFMLTLSTHVSGFTLHTVIWFTLSKHMLGSKYLDFHMISFFSYLHSPLMFEFNLYAVVFTLLFCISCLYVVKISSQGPRN